MTAPQAPAGETDLLRPAGAVTCSADLYPGLAPWATFFRPCGTSLRKPSRTRDRTTVSSNTRGVLWSSRLLSVVFLFFSFLFSLSAASAADLTRAQQVETLNEALRAFDRGNEMRRSNPGEAGRSFREATDKFQLLVDSGIANGKLYYNLGNSYLRAGRLGQAIANYRRAERLIPADGQLEANLRFARTLCKNQIAASGQRAFLQTFFAWHHGVPIRYRYAIGLAAYVLFWLLLVGRMYFKTIRWSIAIVPAVLLWLVLGSSVVYENLKLAESTEGVITADDVTVRKGNGEGFEPQFEQPLHQGVEFSVIEQRKDWIHIRLPDNNSGWIRSNKVELIS